MNTSKGHVIIKPAECKGCQLCINACPAGVLTLGDQLNQLGYRPAAYKGEGCTGCGICFYTCPEPGAITVLKGWDKWEQTAYCPVCKSEQKVYPLNGEEEVFVCTNCLNPIS